MVYTTAAIEVTTKLTIDYGGKDSMSNKLIIFSSLLIVVAESNVMIELISLFWAIFIVYYWHAITCDIGGIARLVVSGHAGNNLNEIEAWTYNCNRRWWHNELNSGDTFSQTAAR